MRAKMKYICKKFINHQIKKCLLFRCRHAVVIMQTLNWTNQRPLFMTVRHIFLVQWGWPPTETSLVSHARGHWWTLDFANAFVSPGVNSRGELLPSHGASRRRLGDKVGTLQNNGTRITSIWRSDLLCAIIPSCACSNIVCMFIRKCIWTPCII
jgi:hypothetical protein